MAAAAALTFPSSASVLPHPVIVTLEGGPPWGIRLQGGFDYAQQLQVAKVNTNSKASCQGVQAGDVIISINGLKTDQMNYNDALQLFQNTDDYLVLELTSRPAKELIIPVQRIESPDWRDTAAFVEKNMQSEPSSAVYGGSDYLESSIHIPSHFAQSTCNTPSSTVVWSPSGQHELKTYQPVRFDSTATTLKISPGNEQKFRSSVISKIQTAVNDLNHAQSLKQALENVTSSLNVQLALSNEKNKMGEKIKRLELIHSGLGEDSDIQMLPEAHTLLRKSNNLSKTEVVKSQSESPNLIEETLLQSSQMPLLTFIQTNPDTDAYKDQAKISVKSIEIGESKSSLAQPLSKNVSAVKKASKKTTVLGDTNDLNQKDWYKQVFKALHKVEGESDTSIYESSKVDKIIPPRPKNMQKLQLNNELVKEPGELLISTTDALNRQKSVPTKKGVEIPPCGLRYLSKPCRSDPKSSQSSDRKATFSSSPSTHPNSEIHQPSWTMDMKTMMKPNVSNDSQKISSQSLDANKRKDDTNILYTDKYWLELAGLNNTEDTNQRTNVIHQDLANSASRRSFTKAVALYPFQAKTDKELSFEKGDVLILVRLIDKNWFKAEHNGRTGLVPCSYFKVASGSEKKLDRNLGKAVAQHSFVAKFPSELSFDKGDILTVVRRVDGNWYEGQINQQTGIFPISYVEPVFEPIVPSSLMTSSADVLTGVESPVSVSPGSSVLSTTAPSAPTSPYETWTSENSQFDFDKSGYGFNNFLVETYQNANIDRHEQLIASDNRGKTASRTTPVESGNSMDQLHNPVHQCIRPERVCDPFTKMTVVQKVAPNLHLLFEEPWYQVLYNYTPQHDDELELHEGDLVYLLEKCDDGWCVGRSDRTRRVGTFPGNYVKQLG